MTIISKIKYYFMNTSMNEGRTIDERFAGIFCGNYIPKIKSVENNYESKMGLTESSELSDLAAEQRMKKIFP
ncbi:MAG: hypothetical protein PHN56_05115 [Candidatus Nanoarchaeia archaeon]|nr:hypothetical protein [Candidatus Nanoarchaeia archaeon]